MILVVIVFTRNIDDTRFAENASVLHWLEKWEDEAKNTEGATATERSRRFISKKTKFDLFSMVLGFKSFCAILIDKFQGVHITSHQTSQDYLELFFACQRAQNGQSNNPSLLQYGKS